MQTIEAFMPTFFAQVSKHGDVDVAMAAARGVARGQPDFWVPVLYSRLSHGRIWYVPGFTQGAEKFESWPNLLSGIEESKGTPILGLGLLEPLLGSTREIAQGWAREDGLPFDTERGMDLTALAQQVAMSQSEGHLRTRLAKYMRGEMLRRYADLLAAAGI